MKYPGHYCIQKFVEYIHYQQQQAKNNPGKLIKLFAGSYILYDGTHLWDICKISEGEDRGYWTAYASRDNYLDPMSTLKEIVAAISN